MNLKRPIITRVIPTNHLLRRGTILYPDSTTWTEGKKSKPSDSITTHLDHPLSLFGNVACRGLPSADATNMDTFSEDSPPQ